VNAIDNGRAITDFPQGGMALKFEWLVILWYFVCVMDDDVSKGIERQKSRRSISDLLGSINVGMIGTYL
jgi:hypothetical protein